MRTPRPMKTGLLLLLLAGLLACSKEKEKEASGSDDSAEESATEEEQEVAQKDPSSLLVGDAPAVPESFKGLELGMSAEEAKKIESTIVEENRIEHPAYEDVMFYADFGQDEEQVERLYFTLPAEGAKEMVTEAWGEPKVTKDLGKDVFMWFNPDEGLRAALKEGFGEEMNLELTAYVPAAEFLGSEGKTFAFEEEQPLLGATVEDLREGYPEEIVEKSQKEAEKDRKDLEKLAGKKVKKLGKAKPSVHLEFLPTEYGQFSTRVHLTFDDENKVRRYWFGLAFEPYPEAKETLMGLLEEKLGEPKEGKDLGDTIYIFSPKDPYIEAEEDTISNKWDVTVEAK